MQPLPADLFRLIDPICDRFESDWRAGRAPRLESLLDEVGVEARPELLRCLLELELELMPKGVEHSRTATARRSNMVSCRQQ